MEELEQLRRLLAEWRPVDYDSLPDLDLYKDQMLEYMQRQLPAADDALTGAMINNYIKSGLLPRPVGKRYQRQHLAILTALCQLKQVLPMADIGALLAQQPDAADPPAFYRRYLEQLDRALQRAADRLPQTADREALARGALELALQSYADLLVARQLLGLLTSEDEKEKGKGKKQHQEESRG